MVSARRGRFRGVGSVFRCLALTGASSLLTVQTSHAQLGDRIRINGYSSFEFEWSLSPEGRGDPNGSFDADLFDLVLNFRPTDRLRVAADITWEHGVASEDGRGNAAIEYAFAEYSVSERFRVRAGKMFVHFGIYNEIHTAKPAFLTVKEPLSTNKNHKFGSDLRFYPRWSTGIAVTGRSFVSGVEFEYIAQLTNGEQSTVNPFEEDENREKAILARVRSYPVGNLVVGASFYQDHLSEFAGTVDTGGRTRVRSVGGQVQWSAGPWGVELELVRGSVSPSAGAAIKRKAHTSMVSYALDGRWTPYLRLETLDPNTAVSDDWARLWVYGINVQIDDGLFFKVELDTVRAGIANARFGGVGFTELKASIAVGF